MKKQVLLLVCTALVVATLPVKAKWTLETRLVSYTNPGNIDFQGQCCDPHTLCISACDVFFTFCLRSINLSPANPGDCQQFVTTTREYTATNDAIYPPTEGPLYAGSPVSNPIRFYGNYWSGKFQLLVSTEDADTDPDDLIDRNAFNQVLPPTGAWTEEIRVHGFYKAAHVAMQFKASCDRYYYSQTCTVYCKAQDDSVEGHYNCNSEGGKVCLTGWSDPDTNCLTPICADGCRNGVCSEPGECSCLNGWFGELCDECHPGPSCSAEHGRCISTPGECICDTRYGGTNCDQDLDVCGHQEPCLHGATCSNDGPDQYSCSCAAGYTGNNCQTEINECGPLPCLNGATCIDLIGEFNCQCGPGWTGHTCDINIDDCDPNPCDYGGTCTDLVDGYMCECPTGYLQPDCEGHQCDLDPCENGANCTNTTDGYECVCIPGYTGFNCSEEADECESSPCENGATCTDLFADFNCTCQAGFTGDTCQFDIDECIGAECSPHSICIDGTDSYTCLCNQGYTGEYCDAMIDYCALPSPCQNGATCISFVSGPSCHCAPGYTGDKCGQEIDNHCANNPCLNDGTCINMPLTYKCSCLDGWTGSHCEEQASACESNPCLEEQICLDTDNFSYECQICTIDGCEIVVKPIFGSATPSPSNSPTDNWIIYGSVVGGTFFLIFICFFLVLFCMLAFKMRKKHKKSLYQSLSAQEIRQVHNNPTYVDPRELVTSKSYAAEIQRTPEGIPLVNPMAATYGAQTSPSSSNQLAPPPSANKSSTLTGRSGKYDRLQPQDDEEEEAFDNPTQNDEV